MARRPFGYPITWTPCPSRSLSPLPCILRLHLFPSVRRMLCIWKGGRGGGTRSCWQEQWVIGHHLSKFHLFVQDPRKPKKNNLPFFIILCTTPSYRNTLWALQSFLSSPQDGGHLGLLPTPNCTIKHRAGRLPNMVAQHAAPGLCPDWVIASDSNVQ